MSRARFSTLHVSSGRENDVTVLADSGSRYQSKIFNPEFLKAKGLPLPPWLVKS